MPKRCQSNFAIKGRAPFAQRQNVDRFSSIAIVNDIALYFK